MAAGNAEGVKAVFGRCLMQCPSVDLWFMYLKFIKKVGVQIDADVTSSNYAAAFHDACQVCTSMF